jgi:hypothetical protein
MRPLIPLLSQGRHAAARTALLPPVTRAEYRYLPASIEQVPQGEAMLDLLRNGRL